MTASPASGDNGNDLWFSQKHKSFGSNVQFLSGSQAPAAPTPAATSVAQPAPATPTVPEQRTQAATPAAPSPAYVALAQLGRREPRLGLSAADCRALEPMAADWFTRGVDADCSPEALPDGLCRPCRTTASDTAPAAPAAAPVERDVHALISRLRDLTRLP